MVGGNVPLVQLDDEKTNRFQQTVVSAINELRNLPILQGVQSNDISIGTSVTLVPHKLGRSYRGYLVTNLNANAVVYVDSSSTADPASFIPLKASASCTVDLWVF
jgi:hypothetical protein